MTNLRWKVVTILGVFIIFCAVGVYPIATVSRALRSRRSA